jgi:hypothetical protein
MRKKELELEKQRVELYEMKRNNISDYFLKFSRFLRPWVIRLAKCYKECGDYVIHPFILADLYNDERDMEIALIASLLIDENKDIYAQVSGLKNVLGESPFDWYVSRRFAVYDSGDPYAKVDGTEIRFSHLSSLFHRLWDIEGCAYFDKDVDETNIRRYFIHDKDLEDVVREDVINNGDTPFMSLLSRLNGVKGVKRWYWNLNFMLIRLFRRDGFGLGLWGDGNQKLQCPVNRDLERFLGTLFPNYRRYGTIEDGISLIGFEDSVDFLYAYYGFKKLCAEKPKECQTFATTYRKWYDTGRNLIGHNLRLKGILPEIDW